MLRAQMGDPRPASEAPDDNGSAAEKVAFHLRQARAIGSRAKSEFTHRLTAIKEYITGVREAERIVSTLVRQASSPWIEEALLILLAEEAWRSQDVAGRSRSSGVVCSRSESCGIPPC
jgi:hypothetical protein